MADNESERKAEVAQSHGAKQSVPPEFAQNADAEDSDAEDSDAEDSDAEDSDAEDGDDDGPEHRINLDRYFGQRRAPAKSGIAQLVTLLAMLAALILAVMFKDRCGIAVSNMMGTMSAVPSSTTGTERRARILMPGAPDAGRSERPAPKAGEKPTVP